MVRLGIYVAGPYSADNVITVLNNMRKGIQASDKLMAMGYSPFCPFLDYHFQLQSEHVLQDFYDYSMTWLEKSDIVVCLPGWIQSKGCRAEVARAKELSIPIFDLDEFITMFGVATND